MSRAAYSSISGQPKTFAIAGSLLLVSVSYVLLLSAPVITRHLRSVVSGVGGVKAFEWLPLACGAGLVLGGASALVFVLTQIAREAERRPYVCMAPVLAAFSACILIGLRAELPLPGVASEQVAVFGLALSVIGGSLVQTSRVSAQMMGLGFTFLPPLSLFVMLWTLSGRLDPAQVVWGLTAQARAFLGMLTLSSFAIAGVATLGRHGDRGLSARLPREQDGYAVYDLEQDVWADEARLRSRGLPGWAIVLAAAVAVGLGFMALKVFLERRPALNFLAPSKGVSAPVNSAPVSTPMDTQPALAPQVEPGAPSLEPAPAAEPPPSAAPAVVPVSESATEKQANEEQPVREQIAAQPAAPELSQKAAAAASPKVAHHARDSHKAKVAHAARAPKFERPAPAPKAEKPAPVTQVRGEKSAPVAAKIEPPKPEPKAEPKPVEVKKPAKPQSVADLAVQAAAVATEKSPAKAAPKQAPTELDELMDNVLNSKSEKGKKQKMTDDPIYGL